MPRVDVGRGGSEVEVLLLPCNVSTSHDPREVTECGSARLEREVEEQRTSRGGGGSPLQLTLLMRHGLPLRMATSLMAMVSDR